MAIDRARYSSPGFRTEDTDELRDFFETSSIGLHWVGADGTILRANPADYELLGYDADEFIGRNISEFHADAAVIRDILERLGNNERLHDYRARLRCKDGSIKHVLIDSSVLWRNGEFVHTRCFTRDDTARFLAEDEARASVRRIATMADALPVLISYVDRDLRYRFNNHAYEEWFGHSREELQGRTVRDVLGEAAEQTVIPYARRALAGETITYDALIPYRDGGERWVRASYMPDRTAAGDVAGFYAIVTDISQEHASTARLAESQEMLSIALGTARLGAWQLNLETQELVCTAQCKANFGRGEHEPFTYADLAAAIHPEDAAVWAMEVAHAVATCSEFVMQYRAIWRDRSVHWIEVNGICEPGEDGAAVRMRGVTIDVTDRKLAADALIESEERYALAMQATHDAIWDWDLLSGVTQWTPALTDRYGWSPPNLRTSDPWWGDRIHPDHRERVTAGSQQAIDGDVESWQDEYPFRCENGDYRHVLDRAFIIRDAVGAAVRMVGSMSDVTERHAHEASLRASEERYRTLAQALPAYVGSFDTEGRAQYLNDRWLQTTGRTIGQMLDHGWTEIVHPDDLPNIIAELSSAAEEGRSAEFEYRIRAADDSWRWFLGSTAAAVVPDGAAPTWIGASTDITERKRAEGILSGERRSLERLASGAPLAEVLGSLARTSDEASGGDSVAAILLLDDGRLRHGAAPGLPDSYNAALEGIEACAGVGTCAHAAATDQIVITPDIEHDERWQELRDLPLGIGLRAAWSMPIRGRDGRVLGTFGTYFREAGRVPSEAEQREVAVLAHTAAVAIERLAAVQSLRASESQYRALISAMPALVVTTTASGKVDYISESFQDFSGLTLGEVQEAWLTNEIIHPDDLERSAAAWERARTSLKPMQNEMRLRRHDGAYCWHLVNAEPVLDAHGSAARWITVSIDIDARKKAEQALAYQLTVTQTMTENASVAMVMRDRDGRLTFMNPAAELLTGYRVTDVLGQMTHDLTHFRYPDGRPYPASECPFVRANAQAAPLVDYEDVFVRPDGSFYNVLCNVAPLEHEGERVGSLMEIRDITEQKRGEAREDFLDRATEAMNSSLEYDSMLVKLAELAVPSVADIGVVGVFRDTPETLRFGTALAIPAQKSTVERVHLRTWQAGDGAGRNIGEVMMAGETLLIADAPAWIANQAPNTDQRNAASALGANSLICTPLMVRGQADGMMTFAVTAASGRRFTEGDRLLLAELGRRAGLALENARLFTNLKTTAEDLERANAAKDEFLGLVSHELKTPITTIFGNAEILQNRGESLDAGMRQGAIADIRQESERLHRIVDNLLVLARLERGQVLETEPMLMSRIARRVIDAHRQRFPHRKILLTDETHLKPALAAPEYIEQILRNLLSNAEKYSPRETEIEVAISSDDSSTTVRVLDRGQGLPADELDDVFTPFYRSPRSSTAAPGAGIGLAVCRRLIEAQRGHIWAAAREDGGAEFAFTVPVASDDGLAE